MKCGFRASHFVFLLSTIFICSCGYFKREDDKEGKHEKVARVFDKFLYENDIAKMVPPKTSPEDSMMMVKSFMDSWIRQNVVLHKAEANLTDDQKNVEKQLEEYRNSLITYIYESELIRQKLDTVVGADEIEKYYNANPRNFELKDNIIKAIYVKTKKNAPKLDKLRQWYKSDSSKDILLLEEYCHQFAGDFYLDDKTWLLFDELLKKIPIKTYDKEEFLKNNRYIEIEDTSDIYFVNIKGFMIKESLSPLSFERENIRSLIINKRKQQLVQEMERAAYDQAVKNNDFEIYTNEKKK
ncbi:MAG TPA: hypothetical protein VJY62_16380 [Bacteroidia bacterium]|nr:hypothetical protein [Bacteroidia bacterium]